MVTVLKKNRRAQVTNTQITKIIAEEIVPWEYNSMIGLGSLSQEVTLEMSLEWQEGTKTREKTYLGTENKR